ncbi:MAG: DUF2335 domain-containing protein [Candidatus Dadabacteria bacterium]|nr:DUF2335 domain-containing protein [Candidatus Dadabacteria bacterium]
MPEKKQLVNPDEKSLTELETEKIDEILAESFPDVSGVAREEIRGKLVAVLRESHSFFSGPLPPPQFLKEYEEILPGSADRIVALAENEQGIRGNLITTVASIAKWKILSSTVVSVILTVGLIFGGLEFAKIGEATLGGLIGGSAIIPVVVNIILIIKSLKENND